MKTIFTLKIPFRFPQFQILNSQFSILNRYLAHRPRCFPTHESTAALETPRHFDCSKGGLRHSLSLGERAGRGKGPSSFLDRLPLPLFFPLAAILTLAGCGQQTTPSTQPTESRPNHKGTIALSVLTLANPFFKEIADTMADEAAKHGYDVLTVSGDFDVARQQNQVKDFIVRKAAAIVLTPCDSKAIGPAIKEANDAGIPVFTADIACLAPDAKVVSHIATDNYGGGKEAAKAMIEALGESGGKIGILHHALVESCILRVKGFREVIDQYNGSRTAGRIAIVSELPGGGVKDQGFRAAQDLLQAHSDLVGIFAINDPSALGARAAVEKAGKESQVRIIGFDGQTEGKQAIKEGKLYADPIQFPDRIGRQTVITIVKHFAGEKIPAETLIPTALYRKADAEKDPTLK